MVYLFLVARLSCREGFISWFMEAEAECQVGGGVSIDRFGEVA